MKLYNGIELPDVWPPETVNLNCSQPMRIPYLEHPPEVVNVNTGRQLFVDDFLINHEKTSAVREFHYPVKYPCNPIFFPQTDLELNHQYAPCATCKCGGVQFDRQDGLYKMWYMTSYCGNMAYAESRDGIHWLRPELDVVPGTNICLKDIHPDSGSVIIDDDCRDASQRFKMMVRQPDCETRVNIMLSSPDGIHWSNPLESAKTGDRSTLFYNPFTRKWVQSIREWDKNAKRCRYYFEHDDFYGSAGFNVDTTRSVPWMRADDMDAGSMIYPQLYNFDAMAYESIMIGMFQIFRGPENDISEKNSMPKLTELNMGYSRDGFHFHRPDRNAFIAADRRPGSWEYGYVESSAGFCHIVGDELWFYYSAYAGDRDRQPRDWRDSGVYANGAVGLAKLRRDGFASLNFRFSNAKVSTRPVVFNGNSLYVNANTSSSMLKIEVSTPGGETIDGFAFDDCIGFIGNSTCTEIRWREKSIAELSDKPICLNFTMDRGELYSFEIRK